ncbi:hypothetical protein AB835_04730 [Candidatus Endobugula sertula]|uniref:Uncharacterized protein n=1 Tax=Candidatus Endobugula sertula TaxID=62101 RepID=A0A1D2QRF4_9GAMM|nr:hypothetical protein AB835_04730 [Candidatus Endobugula sertula]
MTQAMAQPQFYLVWREGSHSNTPTFKHPNYGSAVAECKRLTRENGGKFYILAHVATAEKRDIDFTEVDQIPF